MNADDLGDLLETFWLFVVGLILIATLPIWFIPYTVYKGWRYVQPKLKEKST